MTALHTSLLRAASLQGKSGLEAWRYWCENVSAGTELDGVLMRVLPAIHSNLGGADENEPSLSLLEQIHERSRTEVGAKLELAAEVVETLQTAGFEPLILKGAALALTYYGDVGARPMSDVDIALPDESIWDALGVLADHGWTPTKELSDRAMRYRHAIPFTDPELRSLDVHRRLFPGSGPGFWRTSVPLDIRGVETRALAPEEMLLHVLAHAWMSGPTVQPVGLLDAAMVIHRTADSLDWDRVIRSASDLHLSLCVSAALQTLAHDLDVPVPDQTLSQLDSLRISGLERLEGIFRRRTSPAAWLVLDYVRMSRELGVLTTLSGIGGYLSFRFATRGRREPSR